jgi:hypothetical protein
MQLKQNSNFVKYEPRNTDPMNQLSVYKSAVKTNLSENKKEYLTAIKNEW